MYHSLIFLTFRFCFLFVPFVYRLAPREHVKALYRDTSLLMPRDRTIAVKSDLIKAVNNSPVPLPPGAARAALAGGPTKPSESTGQNSTLPEGSITPSKIGKMSIISTGSNSGGPNLIDRAIENTARAMQDLEIAVNVHAEKYNRMKNALEEKHRKLASLKGELAALHAADDTITELESKTQLLTAGHPSGHDPLTSPVSIYESVPGLIKFDPDDNSGSEDMNDSDDLGSEEGDNSTYRSSTIRDPSGTSTIGPSASRMLSPSGGAKSPSGSKYGGGGGSVVSGQIELDRMKKLRKLIKQTRRRIARAEYRKRQYEYMMERYRSNAEVLERHMKGVEEAMHAAKRELNEVNAYQRVLAASKEAVAVELHRVQLAANVEKVIRAKKLEDLQTELNKATQMEIWRKQREAVRSEMAAELAGDLSKEQEDMLLNTLTNKQLAFQRLQLERRQREERAASLQEAFNKIKTSTGITTLNEMAEKFLSQPTQRAQLAREKADAEAKLNNAKDAYEKAQKEYNDIRATGASSVAAAVAVSAVMTNHPGNDELELQESATLSRSSSSAQIRTKIENTKQEIRSLVTVCDRISQTINAVHQGVQSIETPLATLRTLLPSSQRAIAQQHSNTDMDPTTVSSSSSSSHDAAHDDQHSVTSSATGTSNQTSTLGRGKSTRLNSALPISARAMNKNSLIKVTTATDPVMIGENTFDTLFQSEVTGTVVIHLLARAVQAYLQWSITSRDNSNNNGTNSSDISSILPVPSLTNYNGTPFNATSVPIPKKSYSLQTDHELLQYLNTYLAFPYVNGTSTLDTPLLTDDQLQLLRNVDLTTPLTPGVANQILSIVNTVSIRMLAVAGNAPGHTIPTTASNNNNNHLTDQHHPSDTGTNHLPMISEQNDQSSTESIPMTINDLTVTNTATTTVPVPVHVPLMTIESTIAMLGDVHWNPRKNMDPVLHGNNVRVTPYNPNINTANEGSPSKTGKKGKKKNFKKNLDDEEDDDVPTKSTHELSAYYKRQQALFEAAGLSSIGGFEPEISEEEDNNNPEAHLTNGVYDPLVSGLRTGITSTQRFMEAAKRHRHEMQERAMARAQYTSTITMGENSLNDTNHGPEGSGDSNSDEDQSDDDNNNNNDKSSSTNNKNTGTNKGKTGNDKKGGKGSTTEQDNKNKKIPVSIASIIAQDVDPDGLLDRKLIKRLAKEMDTVEVKRKQAEVHAATATGRIALQKALQRRTSLARLMTGIATNPIATFANSGRGELQPTTTNLGNTKSLSDTLSTETMKNDQMLGNNGSVAQLLSGLAVYTTRPKLR